MRPSPKTLFLLVRSLSNRFLQPTFSFSASSLISRRCSEQSQHNLSNVKHWKQTSYLPYFVSKKHYKSTSVLSKLSPHINGMKIVAHPIARRANNWKRATFEKQSSHHYHMKAISRQKIPVKRFGQNIRRKCLVFDRLPYSSAYSGWRHFRRMWRNDCHKSIN